MLHAGDYVGRKEADLLHQRCPRDMLETASRRLNKVLSLAARERAGAGEEVVERAKAAVASLTTRLGCPSRSSSLLLVQRSRRLRWRPGQDITRDRAMHRLDHLTHPSGAFVCESAEP